MDSTSLNPIDGHSRKSIDFRKTFARLAFYCDQVLQGHKHEDILESMELEESEWKYILSTIVEISQLGDFDARICYPTLTEGFTLGVSMLVKKPNTLLMRF